MQTSSSSSTLCLLTYSRNDVEGVLRNLVALRPLLAEFVVIDSSGPTERAKLEAALQPPRERLYAALPLGNSDLLRPFGLAKCVSERVLQLDSDETLSPALKDELPRLTTADAYVVPRWEVGARGFTYHMRIFRRRSVSYIGPSHGFPRVVGHTEVLPRRLHFIHQSEPARRYWNQNDRKRRYLLSDFLERPYDWRYFQRLLGLSANARRDQPGIPSGSISIDPLTPVAKTIVFVEAVRMLILSQSPGLAQFVIEQARQRSYAWRSMNADQRDWLAEVARAVRASGGLVQYLRLADEAYVESLNRAFGPNVDGPRLLAFLLSVRARSGAVWQGTTAPPEVAVADNRDDRSFPFWRTGTFLQGLV
jgi:hypothetical protein